MKTSLICTVLNEEKTISSFLESIFQQSKLPDEIIIVDGGSIDETVNKISEFKFPDRKNVPNIKLLFKDGNRSVGRNEAIEKSSGEILLITDAGCILDKDWTKHINYPFIDKNVDVVAGYYKSGAKNVFQKCLTPYVLVMEDKVNKDDFLPATRSMAIRKTVWEKLKGFDEKLSHNEDYAFANKIKEKGFKIIFSKSAIITWIPRGTLKQAFIMFFRFALGDIQANIIRKKVIYIFVRYVFALLVLLAATITGSLLLFRFLIIGFLVYSIWAIWKNYKYVKDVKAIIYLPLFQFTSDLAVLFGSSLGFMQKVGSRKFLEAVSLLKK